MINDLSEPYLALRTCFYRYMHTTMKSCPKLSFLETASGKFFWSPVNFFATRFRYHSVTVCAILIHGTQMCVILICVARICRLYLCFQPFQQCLSFSFPRPRVTPRNYVIVPVMLRTGIVFYHTYWACSISLDVCGCVDFHADRRKGIISALWFWKCWSSVLVLVT